MQKITRKPDTHAQVERLEKKHSLLKLEIATLEQQRFLTADEDLHVQALKKAKLATKDQLSGLLRRPH